MSYTFQEYVDDLFKVAVGTVGYSSTAFFSSSPREVELAIEGYNDSQKHNFYLSEVAMKNAIGQFLGGKKFKPVNPFATEEEKKKKVFTSAEAKETEFNYLLDKFKTEEGEEVKHE